MRMKLGLVVLVACVLAGCSSQTFDMPYPIAVARLTDLYPAMEADSSATSMRIMRENAAYSQEGGGSPWGVSADHEELAEGKAYRISIHKVWYLIPPRETTFTITSVGDARTKVEVDSYRVNPFGTVRDGGYEAARMLEVRDTLKLPDNAMFDK